MIKTKTFKYLHVSPVLAGLLLAVTAAAPSRTAAQPGPKRLPNIIFMLADDLGYGDLSCYNPDAKGEAPNNTPIRTPALDSMAKNGARLTDFHSAAPLCSPSRRALLSARYASRLGEWAEAYRGSPDGMVAAKEPTIGMWLKQAGYATACYGKWNVGEVKDVSWPGAHGFDDWLIIDHNTGYFQHQNRNKDCQGREMLFGTGGVRVTDLRGRYLTDIWTDKALEFIDTNADKPFFLYLPFAVPHSPLQDPADPSLAFDEQPKAASPEAREAFVKMVEYLDSRIAKMLGALDERGLTDNTLIMFTSDNGGMRSGNCWPLKQQKQWLEEGGIRVPCLMQWPGVIPPETVSTQPSIMMDASVTMLTAGDALKHVPPGRKLDGIDLLPILQGKAEPVCDRVLGWRRRDWSPNFNSLRQEAFRVGDWKLLRSYRPIGKNKRSAEPTVELFNLADDISEAKDLAQANPEKLAAMQAAFDRWQQAVVEQDPDYLIPVPDQLGSPAKYPPVSMLFDFKRDRLDGKLLTRNNETRISEPVIQDGVFKARLSPGLVHPTPLLYRDGAMATTVFSAMRVRMRVTVEGGSACHPVRGPRRRRVARIRDRRHAVAGLAPMDRARTHRHGHAGARQEPRHGRDRLHQAGAAAKDGLGGLNVNGGGTGYGQPPEFCLHVRGRSRLSRPRVLRASLREDAKA